MVLVSFKAASKDELTKYILSRGNRKTLEHCMKPQEHPRTLQKYTKSLQIRLLFKYYWMLSGLAHNAFQTQTMKFGFEKSQGFGHLSHCSSPSRREAELSKELQELKNDQYKKRERPKEWTRMVGDRGLEVSIIVIYCPIPQQMP